MKKEIKYIGYYDIETNSEENRGYSLAAVNKMNCICRAINEAGYRVLIVSPSRTINKKYYKGKETIINKGIALTLFPTFPWGNKAQKALSLLIGNMMLFLYLITKIKRNETILVYHSLGLMSVVRFSKKIKKFKIILEVEEIYQDVDLFPKYITENEYKTFDSADKYIFSTELLNKKLNSLNKPYSIIYGAYNTEEDRNCKFDDDKIHVVYAGTFDQRKGAAAAAAAAEFLPQKYHIHILGFGSDEQKKSLLKTIKVVDEKGGCRVTYDGLLKGEAYIQFLQKCHIGLSTQNPNASFNATSFPSKILSYMANGLRVVSVRIPAIETSPIGKEISYYEDQTPQAIAEAIKMIDITKPYDSRQLIKELDEDFKNKIKDLLEA